MLARNAARLMSGGMLVALSAVALVPSAYAQQAERRTYEIAPQSLDGALAAFRQQSGLNLLYRTDTVQGISSRGFKGRGSPEQVLAALLEGTSASFRKVGKNSFSIVIRPRAALTISSRSPSAAPRLTAQSVDPAAAEGGEPAEDIVVTGSRIARPRNDTPVPITVVGSADLANSAAVNLADLLQEFPAFGVGLGNANTFRSGDAGAAFVNLRGLGTNRSLTLVNGRRRVSGSSSSSAVDINTIPPSMIERVEIITGGASAVYGADAVSGVVNIITKRNTEGVELSARGGMSQHGGANNAALGFYGGTHFADGRGFINFGAAYTTSGRLRSRQRDFGQYRVATDANPANTGPNDGIPNQITLVNLNDSYVTYDANMFVGGKTYVYGANGLQPLGGKIVRPGSLGSVIGDTGASYADWIELRSPSEVISLRSDLSYEITPGVSAFLEGEFSKTYSKSLEQYYRFDERTIWFNGLGGPQIARDNIFLPASVGALMDANKLQKLPVRRAMKELGDLDNIHDRHSWTIVAGLEGKLVDRFDWRVSYQRGEYNDNFTFKNMLIGQNFLYSVDAIAGPDGKPMCRNAAARAAGCVPFNIFARDDLTQAQRDYFVRDRLQTIKNVQEVVSGQITGTLFDLPAGPLAFAVGGEHRREKLVTHDDGLSLSHAIDFIGLAVPRQPIDKGFTVNEGYGELRVPILRDHRLLGSLEAEGALRISDYSSIGRTTTWNAAGTWAPIRQVRLRASWARSVRAPNLVELYGPRSISIVNFVDPCDAPRLGETTNRRANCAALGVPANFRDTFVGTTVTSGGNPDLKAETSNSFSVGGAVNFGPLNASIDYFHIKLADAVTSFAADAIATRCVDAKTIDNIFCKSIKIDTDGSLIAINSSLLNVARQETQGIDFALDYARQVGPGTLRIGGTATLLLQLELQTDPNDPNTLVIQDGRFSNPRWLARQFAEYQIGRVSARIENQFISKSMIDPQASKETYDLPTVSARVYTDLTLGYKLGRTYTFRAGINNLLDVEPPFTASTYLGGGINGSAVRYDNVGRFFFLGVEAKF